MLSSFSAPLLLVSLLLVLLPTDLLARPDGGDQHNVESVNKKGAHRGAHKGAHKEVVHKEVAHDKGAHRGANLPHTHRSATEEPTEENAWILTILKLANVALNAGEAITDAVGTNSGVGEVVAESHQELLLLVPQIKSNVSEALELVPEALKSQVKEQLDELPSEENLHLMVDNLTAQVPGLEYLGDTIKEGLAILPDKDEVAEGVDAAFELTPQADLVHAFIDTVVGVSNLAASVILPWIPASNDNEVTAAEDVELIV